MAEVNMKPDAAESRPLTRYRGTRCPLGRSWQLVQRLKTECLSEPRHSGNLCYEYGNIPRNLGVLTAGLLVIGPTR